MTANVLQLPEGGDFEASAAADQPGRNPPETGTKLHVTTEPQISCRCC